MLYPNPTRILPFVLVLHAFVLPLPKTNPNVPLAFESSKFLDTPRINAACTSLSLKRDHFTPDKSIEYKCFCHQISDETRHSVEALYISMYESKTKNRGVLKALKRIFAGISNYLQTTFEQQEADVKSMLNDRAMFINNKRNPFSTFVFERLELPLDKFAIVYSNFLMNQILEKYEDVFNMIGSKGVKALLKNEFGFLNCNVKERHGEFEDLLELVKFINQKVSIFIGTFAKMK